MRWSTVLKSTFCGVPFFCLEYEAVWSGGTHDPVLPNFQPPDQGGPFFIQHGSGFQGLLAIVLEG